VKQNVAGVVGLILAMLPSAAGAQPGSAASASEPDIA